MCRLRSGFARASAKRLPRERRGRSRDLMQALYSTLAKNNTDRARKKKTEKQSERETVVQKYWMMTMKRTRRRSPRSLRSWTRCWPRHCGRTRRLYSPSVEVVIPSSSPKYVDAPRELRRDPKSKPPRRAASPLPVFTSISVPTSASASTSTPSPPPQQPSSPVTRQKCTCSPASR